MEDILNESQDQIPDRRNSQFQEENVQPVHKPLHHYRFTKQTLPGWRPVLTTFQAMLVLLSLCVAFLVVGLVIVLHEDKYNQVRVRYDDKCNITTDTNDLNEEHACVINLNVEKDIKGNLEIRYELTKFYQNQRRFGYSRVDDQLAGKYVDYSGMDKCKPYRSENSSSNPESWTLPCGLYALTVFNDTFKLEGTTYAQFSEEGIAFKSELDDLFKPLNSKYTEGNKWLQNNELFNNSGQTNEHFIVWMRQSALPHIKKTYAKCSNCEVKAGRYKLKIWSRYPTKRFGGEKYFTLTKVTPLGAHNTYIGIVFLACGGVTGLYGIILMIAELIKPRPLGRYEDDERSD